jgi:hypothetical protein
MALLDDALAACGGLDRWRELESFTLHISITGALLARNGKPGLLKEIVAAVCDRFTEGFGSKDFKAAKGLLDSLT